MSLIFDLIFSPLMRALQVYHLIVDKLKVLGCGNGCSHDARMLRLLTWHQPKEKGKGPHC
jgi:hypothetical protein